LDHAAQAPAGGGTGGSSLAACGPSSLQKPIRTSTCTPLSSSWSDSWSSSLITFRIAAALAAVGLLQYLPAQAAMLILAWTLAAGVLYGATRRELWQARWPS